jgi:hypothetical protein
MRALVYCFLFGLLEVCSSNLAHAEEAISRRHVTECIEREALTIAPMKIDLESAAENVAAKCRIYTEALRRRVMIEYPGLQEEVRIKFRDLDALNMELARRAIANARTSQ